MRGHFKNLMLSLAVAIFLLVARISFAEEQPHMEAALHHLQAAAEELRQAEHDKGGHRAKALDLTQQAINHLKAGMHFDETHERKGEGMKKNDKQK